MRLSRLVDILRPAAEERRSAALEETLTAVEELRRAVAAARSRTDALRAHVADTRRRCDDLLGLHQTELQVRSRLAGLPHARLLSDAIVLKGRPSARLRVRRLSAGDLFERPLAPWMGITRCATESADVRTLWARLLESEAGSGDGLLRGFPSTVLDVSDATLSRGEAPGLRVSLEPARRTAVAPAASERAEGHALSGSVVAVPRCTVDFPARKVRNFGHWLLDCAPQVFTLATLAPDAVFLLPAPLKDFHRATLELLGLAPEQLVPWDGRPTWCRRALLLERDGRAGGGRPLSALQGMRRRLMTGSAPPGTGRRIYVSRRDARAKRRWVVNEADVEALFKSRGFEIVSMDGCPLDEQVRIFREAGVLAGVSGAGLTDLVFAPSHAHVIVLVSDSLIRWYADEGGSRSLWATGRRASGGQLAALGDSPRFYAHLSAAFEQHCHTFVGGDLMPLEPLTGFLDDVLRQVSRG